MSQTTLFTCDLCARTTDSRSRTGELPTGWVHRERERTDRDFPVPDYLLFLHRIHMEVCSTCATDAEQAAREQAEAEQRRIDTAEAA